LSRRLPAACTSDEHSKGGASVTDVNGKEIARYGRDDRALTLQGAPGDAIVVDMPVRVAVRKGPISGIAVSPDGRRLLVTNYGGDSVSIIDTDTCRVVRTVDGVDEPYAIAIGGRDADRAYVSIASTVYDAIGVIDVSTNTVVATHPLALSVSDLAVSPDGRHVYASRNGVRAADVVIIDTATDKIEVVDLAEVADVAGTSAECVRASSDTTRVYVGTNGPAGGQLVVIGASADDVPAPAEGRSRWRKKNTKSGGKHQRKDADHELRVIDTIDIGLPIRDVALSPNGAIAYVASCGPDVGAVVDVIDTRTNKITNTRKIAEIGGVFTGLTISGDGDRAYLVSDDSITVLCTLTHDVIGVVRATARPSCLVESPDGTHLYIADYDGVVTVAPVVSTMTSIESVQAAAEWSMPEFMRYEEALV
jgi:YVTN family beta-propeller protein